MKILVHLHLYYQDMLEQMLDLLKSLDQVNYDLYVTTSPDFSEQDKITNFHNQSKILPVPNRGYDLAPFVYVLQQVNLDDYDYIIKLHTKRDLPKPANLPNCSLLGGEWRNLLTGFLRSPQALQQALEQFEKHPQVGQLSHSLLIISAGKEDKEANHRAGEIMSQMGLKIKQKTFVAGTMFICRARLMQPLKKLQLTAQDFDAPLASHQGGTLAHALERVLGWMIWAQGYKISVYNQETLKDKLKILGYHIKKFVYRKYTNSKGVTRIKICKIPVYKSSKKL